MGDDSSAIALHRIIPVTGRQATPAPAPPNDLERSHTPHISYRSRDSYHAYRSCSWYSWYISADVDEQYDYKQ